MVHVMSMNWSQTVVRCALQGLLPQQQVQQCPVASDNIFHLSQVHCNDMLMDSGVATGNLGGDVRCGGDKWRLLHHFADEMGHCQEVEHLDSARTLKPLESKTATTADGAHVAGLPSHSVHRR